MTKNLKNPNESDRFVQTFLKTKSLPTIQGIKDELIEARKSRMRTVEYYLCDYCDDAIIHGGFVIHGNIYSADPSCRVGIIGDNITEGSKEIKQTVICNHCLLKATGLSDTKDRIALFDANTREEELKVARHQSIFNPSTGTIDDLGGNDDIPF